MLSPEEINNVFKQLMSQMGNKRERKGGEQKDTMCLTPQQILVIIGLLTGTLQVNSLLVNRSQTVEVVLVGELKVNTADIMGQAKPMSFEDLLKNILKNN